MTVLVMATSATWSIVIKVNAAHDAIITTLLRQNDIASFWRDDHFIIASSVRWHNTVGHGWGTVRVLDLNDNFL